MCGQLKFEGEGKKVGDIISAHRVDHARVEGPWTGHAREENLKW